LAGSPEATPREKGSRARVRDRMRGAARATPPGRSAPPTTAAAAVRNVLRDGSDSTPPVHPSRLALPWPPPHGRVNARCTCRSADVVPAIAAARADRGQPRLFMAIAVE